MDRKEFELNEEELNKLSIEHSFDKRVAFAEKKEIFTVDLHLGADQQYEIIYHPNHISRLSFEEGYRCCHAKILRDIKQTQLSAD